MMAFRHKVDAAVAPLHAALEDGDWKRMGAALHAIPTRAEGKNPAVAVETLRVAADALIEECSFETAFERAFVVRRALHRHDVAAWLVPALAHVHPASPVLRRLVMLTEMLATTEEGRSRIGRARGVDVLVRLWRRLPRSVDIVAALCTLCAGHIDNVSRMMRNGGVALGLQVLSALADRAAGASDGADVDSEAGGETVGESGGEALDATAATLLERTLLLLGLVCICTPDARAEAGALVPALVRIVRVARAARSKRALAAAVAVLGNVGECWAKEERGYIIPADCGLLDAVADAWAAAPRDRAVASASAWALCGLFRVHPDTVPPPKLLALLAKSRAQIAAVRALQDILAERAAASAAGASAPVVAKCKSSEPVPVAEVAAPAKPRGRKRNSLALGADKAQSSAVKKTKKKQMPAEFMVFDLTSDTESKDEAPIARNVAKSPARPKSFAMGSDTVPATPKRRGRPRKTVIPASSPTRIQDNIDIEIPLSPKKTPSSSPTGKHRGRPRKTPKKLVA